jgi:predicted nucleic acid-binding protein
LNLLLDTCVICEGVRPRPDPAVTGWMKSQDADRLFMSVVTLGELHYGVTRLPAGARRRALEQWIAEVERHYAGRIVVLDDAVARNWGRLRAAHPGAPVVDGQIVATALAYDMQLVTRNRKDFKFAGLSVIDPWKHVP